MAQTQTNDYPLDNSLIYPEQDRLGYATFAQQLADSICNMTFTDVFAIAVYGSWSSGKSTLLDFIVHYLKQKPDEEQPIIVPFNPWLFSGHEDITRSFFDQLQNVLSKVSSVPKGLRERIADFANVISEIPLPYAQTGKAVAKLFDDSEKEASELKEEVEETLIQQERRIVITIDDIDRLATEDIRKLFRLLKAIPNFHNVVYLLVFNKEVILKALAETNDISPEIYLEKTIQVAFKLPSPDKVSLRKLLFEKLDNIFTDPPDQLFDLTYWNNVYSQGLDHFITNLHDIIRLIDTLTVTYSVSKCDVNIVDFIAIQSLRVFCPMVHNLIQRNQNAFVGDINSLDELKNFHNSWLAQLQDKDKQPVQNLLKILFPKLEAFWGKSCHHNNELDLRQQQRVCCPEIFPLYFRLTLSEADLSNIQIKDILARAGDAKVFGEKLIELAHQKRLDGTTQVRAFLEKVEDHLEKEIPLDYISSIVEAFFEVGEYMLCPEDEPNNKFDLGNEMKIHRLIVNLLCRLEEPERFKILKKSMTKGKGLSFITRELKNFNEPLFHGEGLISAQHLKELEEILAKRKQVSNSEDKEKANSFESDCNSSVSGSA
jgi:predicted KAP-like P-loop ATPase